MTPAQYGERRRIIADAVQRRKEERDSEVSEDLILREIQANDLGVFHIADVAYDSDQQVRD